MKKISRRLFGKALAAIGMSGAVVAAGARLPEDLPERLPTNIPDGPQCDASGPVGAEGEHGLGVKYMWAVTDQIFIGRDQCPPDLVPFDSELIHVNGVVWHDVCPQPSASRPNVFRIQRPLVFRNHSWHTGSWEPPVLFVRFL